MEENKNHGAEGGHPRPAVVGKDSAHNVSAFGFNQHSGRGVGHQNYGYHDFVRRKTQYERQQDFTVHAQKPAGSVKE